MTATRTATTAWHAPRAVLIAVLSLLLAASAGIIWDDAGIIWDDAGLIWDDASAGNVGSADLIVGLADGADASDLDATVVANLAGFDMVMVRDADADALAANPAVTFVSADDTLAATSDDDDEGDDEGRRDRSAAREVEAYRLWERGITGAGQTVAVVDTGVSGHADLAGRITHGPNFAGDGTPQDLFGHGTVMAGLVAGDGTASNGAWSGVAPEAQILSVKVAGRDGAADVSQVIAALHWLVSCHEDAPLQGCDTTHDAGVVVLAYSTDGTQSATVDPLAFAIQQAHDAGMVVIASAGNAGDGDADTITGPAAAPAAYTVGAYDADRRRQASFSEHGTTVDGIAKPEALASGVDLVSPIDTNSTIARDAGPALRAGDYIRGSGSSQAAAVAGGIAALARQMHTDADASEIRALLDRARDDTRGSRVGRLDVSKLPRSKVGRHDPKLRGDGTGTLNGSRGSVRVFVETEDGTVMVDGDYTATGQTWDGSMWDGTTWTGTTWTGTTWTGSTWDGSTWDGSTWDGSTWDGSTWDGSTWDGSTWDGSTWDTADWS